ncbi:hypothetical protein CB599_11715 [Salmonella enterica subsp. enterica serovar Adjame]|nr:hypothetical protein [Salmonella enterica subsp. enterica serovar Adjame]
MIDWFLFFVVVCPIFWFGSKWETHRSAQKRIQERLDAARAASVHLNRKNAVVSVSGGLFWDRVEWFQRRFKISESDAIDCVRHEFSEQEASESGYYRAAYIVPDPFPDLTVKNYSGFMQSMKRMKTGEVFK